MSVGGSGGGGDKRVFCAWVAFGAGGDVDRGRGRGEECSDRMWIVVE